MSRTSTSRASRNDTVSLNIEPITPRENYVEQFLAKHPDYRKALWLAARSEEEGAGKPSYQGWQWSDLEMHPTRVLKLVIEGLARINMRTRRATFYLLRDPGLVQSVLKSSIMKK